MISNCFLLNKQAAPMALHWLYIHIAINRQSLRDQIIIGIRQMNALLGATCL